MANDVWSLQHVLDICYLEQEELFRRADAIANEYWMRHKNENNLRPLSQRGRMGLRVRRRRGGVQIDWFVMQARTRNHQLLTKHIKRGRRAKVPRKHYEAYCQEWELLLVEEIEEQLAPIRRKLHAIGRVLRETRTLMGELGQVPEDEKERGDLANG